MVESLKDNEKCLIKRKISTNETKIIDQGE